jgi:membrane protein
LVPVAFAYALGNNVAMGRVREIPKLIRHVGPWTFFKRIWNETGKDNLFTWASATAYSWLFAIFPFFLMLLTLLPYLPANWKTEATNWIATGVYQLPKESADTVWINLKPRLDQLLNNPPTGLFSIGLIITIWSASGGMVATIAALNTCYNVKENRGFIWQRLLAIALTVVSAVMILAVLILLPIGTLVTHWLQWWLARQSHLADFLPLLLAWQVARYALALVLMFAIVAILYRYGPHIKPRNQSIAPGAIFCVAVWILLGIGFRVYIDRFGKYNETYGTVGGVAVLLLFFYIDAVVLLIGAEINSELDRVRAEMPELSQSRPSAAPASADPKAAGQAETLSPAPPKDPGTPGG